MLPVIVLRSSIIYFTGSRYNLPGFEFLDVIQHAKNKYFNQTGEFVVDSENDDLRMKVREESLIYRNIKDNIIYEDNDSENLHTEQNVNIKNDNEKYEEDYEDNGDDIINYESEDIFKKFKNNELYNNQYSEKDSDKNSNNDNSSGSIRDLGDSDDNFLNEIN